MLATGEMWQVFANDGEQPLLPSQKTIHANYSEICTIRKTLKSEERRFFILHVSPFLTVCTRRMLLSTKYRVSKVSYD